MSVQFVRVLMLSDMTIDRQKGSSYVERLNRITTGFHQNTTATKSTYNKPYQKSRLSNSQKTRSLLELRCVNAVANISKSSNRVSPTTIVNIRCISEGAEDHPTSFSTTVVKDPQLLTLEEIPVSSSSIELPQLLGGKSGEMEIGIIRRSPPLQYQPSDYGRKDSKSSSGSFDKLPLATPRTKVANSIRSQGSGARYTSVESLPLVNGATSSNGNKVQSRHEGGGTGVGGSEGSSTNESNSIRAETRTNQGATSSLSQFQSRLFRAKSWCDEEIVSRASPRLMTLFEQKVASFGLENGEMEAGRVAVLDSAPSNGGSSDRGGNGGASSDKEGSRSNRINESQQRVSNQKPVINKASVRGSKSNPLVTTSGSTNKDNNNNNSSNNSKKFARVTTGSNIQRFKSEQNLSSLVKMNNSTNNQGSNYSNRSKEERISNALKPKPGLLTLNPLVNQQRINGHHPTTKSSDLSKTVRTAVVVDSNRKPLRKFASQPSLLKNGGLQTPAPRTNVPNNSTQNRTNGGQRPGAFVTNNNFNNNRNVLLSNRIKELDGAEDDGSGNSGYDADRRERILQWLMGVGEKAETPECPVFYEDEPSQTDTAIHIVFQGDK